MIKAYLLLLRSQAMSDFEIRQSGEVGSLLQQPRRSPQLFPELHWVGPYLASQGVEGGTSLQDMEGGFEGLCHKGTGQCMIFSGGRDGRGAGSVLFAF